ncbi:MAG: PorT family protein [Muribaculaceae bacterium]|nr:PorT family protein [Muribaculaceae bacterium]
MKKIAVALMCMIMATGAAMAQKQFTFGPKIGVDYTHFWGKDVSHDGVLNYQAGLFMEYRFNDKVSIAPEVVFAAQGGKYKWVEFNGLEISTTDHLNYINVPVMLKFYVAPSLSIDLGPQLGINIYKKATDKWTAEGKDLKDTYELNGVKTVDFGVGLGLTYNIAKDVFVQGRYTMGMTKVFNSGESKNGNAQIAIGYRF